MRYRTVVRGAGPVIAAAALTVAGCGGGAGAKSPAAEAAREAVIELGAQDVAQVSRAELASGGVLTGSLVPYRVVPVKAQVAGTITGIRVDRGTPVTQGTVLATIEADGIRSQAAAAQANLALARQRQESARVLYEAGAMSEIDYQAAQAAYEAAKAQAAAAGETAERATLKAPITGVVSARMVEEGEAVNPGQELFTVVNSAYLELAGQVPIEQAAGIRPGQPVIFTLSAFPGHEFRGSVDRVEPTANTQTRQVGIYVRLPNPDGRLVGGQFATGRIIGDRVESALVVPEPAVRGGGADTHVLVVENGQIVRRPVTVGLRDEASGRIAVLSGVTEGEYVIAVPSAELVPGTKVRLSASVLAGSASGETAAKASDGKEQ